MKEKNTSIDEIDRFSNLTESELYTLRSIYLKRLNHINKEIRRRHREEDIGKMCIDMMSRFGHCNRIFEIDAENIVNKFDEETGWRYNNRKVPNETLSLATLNVIYDRYNIKHDPYKLVEFYDLDSKQFYVLYKKLSEWANKNYWH